MSIIVTILSSFLLYISIRLLSNPFFRFLFLCRRGETCQRGMRFSQKYLLCGAVLEHLQRLKDLHATYKKRKRGVYSKVHKTRLEVRRAIINVTNDELGFAIGAPVVGLMAVNKEEMDYLAKNMVVPPDAAEDVLRTAHGSNYNDPNAVLGLAAGAGAVPMA